MRRFLIRICCFILPLVIVGISAEFVLMKSTNDYSYKNNYLEKNSNELEVLVLGSSHGFRGVDPECFSYKTFNAAYVSQSLKYDALIFQKFQDNFHSLKALILPISYHSLFTDLEDGREAWRVGYYNMFYGTEQYKSFLDRFGLFTLPSKRVLKHIKYFLLKRDKLSMSESGFGNQSSKNRGSDLKALGLRVAKRHSVKNFEKGLANLELLYRVLQECQKRGVKVHLFTPPAWQSYRDNINEEQLLEMEKRIKFLLGIFPEVRYKNYFSDARFLVEDFRDADHLNLIGAKKLSLLLNQNLKEDFEPANL